MSQLPGGLLDAIAEFQAAVRIKPDYAEAHNNLGVALMNSGRRWPEAIAHFEAALRIRPFPELRQMVNRLRAGRK